MKKSLCVLLCIIISAVSFCGFIPAERVYPESAHPYENNSYDEQYYYYGEEASGLMIKFSPETSVAGEKLSEADIRSSGKSLSVSDVVSSYSWKHGGDYIAIYDGNGEISGIYEGKELSGKEIFVSGSSFSIALVSDDSITDFGYKITDIRKCREDEISRVLYSSGKSREEKTYLKGSEISLPENFYVSENSKFAGWKETPEGNIAYNPGQKITLNEAYREFYAAEVKVALHYDEVFTFSNSSYNFTFEGEDRYIMTPEDFRSLQLNLFRVYGPGPFPNPVLAMVLYDFPNWEWQGSCYGISAVTALQHYGIIDVLESRNAENMNAIRADRELISLINYYQANSATSYLTENKGSFPGTDRYTKSLEYLYKSASEGRISIFTFYKDRLFISSGHTVLITGAYTDAAGNHILIAYDSNRPYNYYSGSFGSYFVVAPDFSSASYNGKTIGALNWTDNFSQFKAFDRGGKGDPLEWYRAYFLCLKNYFIRTFELFTNLFT